MSNLTRKQKEIGLILLASLFCLIMIAYAYFTFYVPKKESLAIAETTLTTDRQVLFALEQQLADQPEIPIVSSLELQKQVPVDPLTELVLLQIEKAEVVSGSLVQSVGFSQGPFVIEAPPEGVEALQELNVSLSIETPTYGTLEAFISELEQMERIVVVDSIQFNSPTGEVTTDEQELEKLQLTLTFSAFYRPDLLKLIKQGPKVDTPSPADKVNPLPANDSIDAGEVAMNETDSEDDLANSEKKKAVASVSDTAKKVETPKPTAKPKVVAKPKAVAKPKYWTYRVKPDDTLYSISRKFYGNRSGEARIRKANGMVSNIVYANSTLIIPQ
ncbi:LysM peptidoglycan-binding domain-containing protein [Paenisporosarcina sp. TG20]|uniref:LysM peptidoglycan-binding domain-containing protein n=1 Tax=Paenisporosarcina sp. TG20 TaxID=1211706 RepID=UPI0003191802|nr:LysM peptidoglycan-binding domain-containing protein [Paenisporosarcina sp. TG20]